MLTSSVAARRNEAMPTKPVGLAHHKQGSVDSGGWSPHGCEPFLKLGERTETNIGSRSPHSRGLSVWEVRSNTETRGMFAQGWT